MHRFLLLTALLAPTMTAAQSRNTPLYGIAHSKDGDSLTVGTREVRLFGIDAPEYHQTCQRGGASWACGAEAADRLSRLVTGREVRCVALNTDQYGRAVSRCSVAGREVNAAMVESGYAVAYRHYSSDYVAAESRAKAARRGLWSGTFEEPSQYRIEERGGVPSRPVKRAPVVARAVGRVSAIVRPIGRSDAIVRPIGRSDEWANRSKCVIKGNQNRRGQFIYHLPGMPYYDQTRPEQIFCSEGEARAAGYRRAIVR